MKRVFIETTWFTAAVRDFLTDEDYARFQQHLMKNPRMGAVMSGCGGLRKVRLSAPVKRRGKRGGVRVIYLDVPTASWTLLLDIYGKNEKDDLSTEERKVLKRLAMQFKRLAKNAIKRKGSS